jgi:hypothetical protein
MINSRHRLFFFVNFKPRLFVKLHSKIKRRAILLFFFHKIKRKRVQTKTSVKKIERRGFN